MDPGLHADGVRNISLPLSLSDAKAVMKAGAQARFGKGSRTVIDTGFINDNKLNPDHSQMRNPTW